MALACSLFHSSKDLDDGGASPPSSSSSCASSNPTSRGPVQTTSCSGSAVRSLFCLIGQEKSAILLKGSLVMKVNDSSN